MSFVATLARRSLRAAWRLLGQPAHALDGGGSVDASLRLARAHFDPAAIPRIAVAAGP